MQTRPASGAGGRFIDGGPPRRVLEAERSALLRLRDRGAINDEVRRRIERELDLQDAWLEA